MARFVLVHSPWVGPATWRPVASVLASERVLVPDLTGVWDEPGPWQPRLVDRVAHEVTGVRGPVPGGSAEHYDPASNGYARTTGYPPDAPVVAVPREPVVLVAHSGAGPLLPGIAAEVVRRGTAVESLILVDSPMPYPGRSWAQEAPPELVAHLRADVLDGRLAPWHRWFPAEALVELVPEAARRAAVSSEIPAVPAAYLDEPVPADRWAGPAGYLLLSDGYRDDAARARAAGWRVAELPSDHLAVLTRPAEVAAMITDLSS